MAWACPPCANLFSPKNSSAADTPEGEKQRATERDVERNRRVRFEEQKTDPRNGLYSSSRHNLTVVPRSGRPGLFVYLFVYLFVCLLACLSVCLSVCLLGWLVGWCWVFLVALRANNMMVYLLGRSSQTIVLAATPKGNLQIKLSVSPSQCMLTPGRPVPGMTLHRQAPGRVATRVSVFQSLVGPGKIPREKVVIEPGSAALEEDALTSNNLTNMYVYFLCGLVCATCIHESDAVLICMCFSQTF